MGPLERITLGLAPVAAAGGWADAATRRTDGRFRLRAVQALLENANHIYQPVLGSNDVGKDAYVDIVVDGDVSGDVIALQIKGGESFRRARGYAIPCTAADRELWRSSSIPVFGVVHDAGKLHWTNLTAWARALASDMRPAAAPGDATFALDERRLPGFLGQARAYLRADGPLRCAPAAPAASFSAVHARSGRARSRDSGVDAHCRPRRHLLDAR